MKQVIIGINFNSMKKSNQRLTRDWIEKRIDIFQKYTLRSLKNQTNQSFITLLRYDEESEDIIFKVLSKYEKLPDNIRFVRNRDYNRNIIENIKDSEKFYLVRLDSDDMYRDNFIQQLYNYKEKEGTKVLINQRGFIYDVLTDRLGLWEHFSPPFYTQIFDTKAFLKDGYSSYKLPGGHTAMINLPHEILPEGNFMIVVHSSNTLTNFDRRFRIGIIEDEAEKRAILKRFLG